MTDDKIKVVPDGGRAKVQSQYRTYKMFGLRESKQLTMKPIFLKWNRDEEKSYWIKSWLVAFVAIILNRTYTEFIDNYHEGCTLSGWNYQKTYAGWDETILKVHPSIWRYQVIKESEWSM